MLLTDDIAYLKGVGPSRAKVLAAEVGIRTLANLLDYLPFRYVDRSVISTVATLQENDNFVVFKGMVSNMQTVATGPRRERLTVDFYDGRNRIKRLSVAAKYLCSSPLWGCGKCWPTMR